ncbi:hypothetical protein BDZ45DRAFT_803416 [Acephala macrosclerotiorum]|nr:hypothetical protein BDZ45DRAFT_803416 [Acephala macrosclerotiorum]
MVSNLTPLYVAETAPKLLRGFLMSLFEMFLVSGGLLAYWTAYGCSMHLHPTSKQWRIPLSIQIILTTIVLDGSFMIVESPRRLAKQDRWNEAAETLAYLRGISSDEAELKANSLKCTPITMRKFVQQRGGQSRSFFSEGTWHASFEATALHSSQCGVIGFTSQNAALFASGMFTVIKVIATVLFLASGIQNFGRKSLFSVGSFFMMATLNDTTSDRAMMATIYLYIIAYSFSWGPLVWVYLGEIFPTRIRDYCIAIVTMIIHCVKGSLVTILRAHMFSLSPWAPLSPKLTAATRRYEFCQLLGKDCISGEKGYRRPIYTQRGVRPPHPLNEAGGTAMWSHVSTDKFYHQMMRRGRFYEKIEKIHRKYNPIVRINPFELYVNDPDFYDDLYNFSPAFEKRQHENGDNTGNLRWTAQHDLHQLRCRPYSSFFSAKSVTKLQDLIQASTKDLAPYFSRSMESKQPINVLVLFRRCLAAADNICDYDFRRNMGFLKDPAKRKEFDFYSSFFGIGWLALEIPYFVQTLVKIGPYLPGSSDIVAFASFQGIRRHP